MAQLRDTLIQGSARVTDTLYANKINLADATASLSVFTDANKNLITKSAADTRAAIGVGASGTHADSYFVKAITSTDNSIVRFDGTAGQIQGGGKIILSDEGYLRSYNTTRWTLDWYIFHPGASKQVAELYFDSGDATNITGGTLYWRQFSPTSTASNTPTAYHETYSMPTVTKDLTANKTYAIITTKNLSSITSVGTITSGTWNGSKIVASYIGDLSGTYKTLSTSQFYGSENTSNFFSSRVKDGGGGWAWTVFDAYKNDKTSILSNFGNCGSANSLSYCYIGVTDNAKSYNSEGNIRLHAPTGTTLATGVRMSVPKLTIGQHTAQNDGSVLFINGAATIQTGGIWVQGGSEAGGDNTRMALTAGMPDKMPYNSKKRGIFIYSNAIAFADPLNGNSNNDAGWIRHLEETVNKGIFEIAVGDDNANEEIVVRRYNTSSTVGKEIKLFDASGNSSFPGVISLTNTTASTSSTTGALVVSGGIATGAASYLTGSVHIKGSAGANALIVRGISGCDTNGNRGDPATASDNAALYLNLNNGPIFLGGVSATATDVIYMQYTQDASSSATGAVRIGGGLGVAKKIYAGNSIIAGGSAAGVEINIKAISNAGEIYFWSANSTTGNRGIWLKNAGASLSNALLQVNQNNQITAMAPLVGNYILDVRGYSYWGSTSRYIKYDILFNNARQRVGETWYDVGDATNVTMGRFYWREYSPNSTATTGTTGKYEDYYLPPVNIGRANSSSYAIITTKNLSDITSVGTLTSDLTLDTAHAVHGILGTFNTTALTDCGGLSWHEVSGVGPSTTLNVNDAPNTDWWYVLRNRHTNTTNNYYTDIALPFNSNGIYYKVIRNNAIQNTGAYNGWVKVLDEFGGIFETSSALEKYGNSTSWVNARDGAIIRRYRNFQGETTASLVNSGNYDTANGRYVAAVSFIGLYYTWSIAQYTNDTLYFDCTNNSHYNSATNQTVASISMTTSGALTANQVYGAVWNDYAEYRKQLYKIEPGRVVYDLDDGYILPTDKRLQPGAQVVSDTFGFAIGETEESKTPLAVTGRVLVYTYRDRYEYHAGDAVCSAPNGTVDIMTREEIKEYPDAIIGIVSEIPRYETWGTSNVPINGRIWIKVR